MRPQIEREHGEEERSWKNQSLRKRNQRENKEDRYRELTQGLENSAYEFS